MRVLGFRVFGFRVLGFRVFGFRVSGFYKRPLVKKGPWWLWRFGRGRPRGLCSSLGLDLAQVGWFVLKFGPGSGLSGPPVYLRAKKTFSRNFFGPEPYIISINPLAE